MDELLPVDLADEPSPLSVCEVCRSPELREDFWVAFRVRVCESCLRADGSRGQTYGLITKSEAQATYLLHDIDLDPKAGGLGFLMKVNPQHQLFSSMKLFLEAQVRALSYSRHGGADGLAAETRRRKAKAQEAKAARRLAQDSALSAPTEGRKRRAQTSSRHIDVAAAIRAAIESAHVCNFQPARASSAASQPSRAQGALEQVRVMECVCGASYELTILVPRAVTVVID